MRSSLITTVAVLLFSAASQAIAVPAMGESSVTVNEKRFAHGEETILNTRSVELEARGKNSKKKGDEKKHTVDSVTKAAHRGLQSAEDRIKAGKDVEKANQDKAHHQATIDKLNQFHEHHKDVKTHEEAHTKAALAHNSATHPDEKAAHAAEAAHHATNAANSRDHANNIAKELGFHHQGHEDAAKTMHDAAHAAHQPGVAHLDPHPQSTRAKERQKSGH